MRSFFSIMLLLFLAGVSVASPLDGVRKAFVEKTIENYAYSDSEQDNYLLYSELGRANDLILLQLYMYRTAARRIPKRSASASTG